MMENSVIFVLFNVSKFGAYNNYKPLARRAVGNFEEKESHDAAPLAHSPH